MTKEERIGKVAWYVSMTYKAVYPKEEVWGGPDYRPRDYDWQKEWRYAWCLSPLGHIGSPCIFCDYVTCGK